MQMCQQVLVQRRHTDGPGKNAVEQPVVDRERPVAIGPFVSGTEFQDGVPMSQSDATVPKQPT